MIYTIYYEGEEIEVEIIRSDRRTLGLQVKQGGQVCARIPRRASDRTAVRFIREHEDWIIRKWMLSRQAPATDPAYSLPPVVTREAQEKARQMIRRRVEYYAERMGVTYGRISMRNQKTRWGSCSSQGNLNFNYRLIFVPERLMDYVIVHELAHRRQMNHSGEFWKEVERYMPDYRARREELKRYFFCLR